MAMNTSGTNEFTLNPADYGILTREELRKLRIRDMHSNSKLAGRDNYTRRSVLGHE
jgi:hypothetical protein